MGRAPPFAFGQPFFSRDFVEQKVFLFAPHRFEERSTYAPDTFFWHALVACTMLVVVSVYIPFS